MKTLTTSLALLIALAMGSSVMAQGQPKALIQQQGGAQAYINPGGGYPVPDVPRLGFTGQMINGYGMKVLHVQPYSLAAELGLEGGDVIKRINGVQVTSVWQYRNLLRDAVMYHGGHADLLVRNVRWDWGYNVPKYVTVRAHLHASGPIAAYSHGAPAPVQALKKN